MQWWAHRRRSRHVRAGSDGSGARVLGLAVGLCLCAAAEDTAAEPLVPGPDDPGHDPALADKMTGYERQLHGLLALPLGFGLEAYVADPDGRALVDAFIASGERDFQGQSGVHPYEVLDRYGEFGDLGMFGGVAAAGDAFRYMVLRDEGAAAAEVEAARDDLLRAMEGLHWYTHVTGEPGVMARGLMRIASEPGEPPVPDDIPETVPLADASGNPLPTDKEPTWRADRSGELPFLVWLDDTSKDQFDGYIFALGAAWDAVAEDPTIPDAAKETLVADALAIGRRLMEKVEVAPGKEVDLVLMDADGRATSFHDLSAEEVAPGVVFFDPTNGFNAWMALGAIRTLFHITGDEALGQFYAYELVQTRGYLDVTANTIRAMFTGVNTNYSNVNMAFVAAYNLLRYEDDPTIAGRAREILRDQIYRPGVDREPKGLGQTFFDFLQAAFHDEGAAGAEGSAAVSEGIATLAGWPSAPYWNDAVENCDPAELAALACTAIDGTTSLTLEAAENWNGNPVATAPLAAALRPPTNFAWRTDPHLVNGSGGDRLNPGGGVYAAYWMGRLLQRGADGMVNVSPHARSLPPAPPDEGEPTGGAGGAPIAAAEDDGCGCRTVGWRGRPPLGARVAWPALLLAAVASVRGRRARRGR